MTASRDPIRLPRPAWLERYSVPDAEAILSALELATQDAYWRFLAEQVQATPNADREEIAWRAFDRALAHGLRVKPAGSAR